MYLEPVVLGDGAVGRASAPRSTSAHVEVAVADAAGAPLAQRAARRRSQASLADPRRAELAELRCVAT